MPLEKAPRLTENIMVRRSYERKPLISRAGWRNGLAALCLAVVAGRSAWAAEPRGATQFHKEIQPILSTYCYDCHADGANKGGLALDQFKSDQDLLENRELWWNVMKFLRAGIMPPAKKSRPTEAERKLLEGWIK